MTVFRLPLADAQTWAAGFIIAGIVHICATFAHPYLSTATGYRRLTATLPDANRMHVLGPITPGYQPLPFLEPDVRYAMCRYTTADGAVSVTAELPDAGWTLAFYDRGGENTYTVAGQQSRRTAIAIRVVPSGDRFTGLSAEAQGAAGRSEALAMPSAEGLVVLRAPRKGLAFEPEIERVLRQARCARV